jgi:hypothetical protein
MLKSIVFSFFLLCSANVAWTQLFGGLIIPTPESQNPAILTTLNCAGAITTGTLIVGQAATSVNTSVPYTGGNGGFYTSQAITSTGVTGLTASLAGGILNSGSGNLVFTITGTPSAAGTASFAISLGGQSCTFSVTVSTLASQYASGSVFCSSGPTAIVEITNPSTGKVWMDRNLGASQVATSSTDAAAYGDLYQWGRRSDGHQCRTSPTTSTLSSTDQPAHGNFILAPNTPYDWRNPQNNNLWQGLNGVNNPCPSGFRIPTIVELNNERISWSSQDASGAFTSPLKLTVGGTRGYDGVLYTVGTYGSIWSSSLVTSPSCCFVQSLDFYSNSGGNASVNSSFGRANGSSVRCIKD